MRDRWSPELVDGLKRLWASGASASAIGAQLGGLSRSAVLGKIFRLRLAANAAEAPKKRRATGRRAKQRIPLPPRPSCEPQGLLDLTNTSCRWPTRRGVGGMLFCGAPEADLAGGMPYCPYHTRRAYVIPPRRKAAGQPKTAPVEAQCEAAPRRPRSIWRAPVRHPAPRRR